MNSSFFHLLEPRSPFALFRSITLQEWVTVAVMAAAMAWRTGWTFGLRLLKEPLLKLLGIKRALMAFG